MGGRSSWAVRGALLLGLAGVAVGGGVGVAAAQDVPTGPNDPACVTMPTVAQCQGGPYALPTPAPPPPALPASPTGPLDPSCMSNPADAACMGSPYLPPPPPAAPPPPAMAPVMAPPVMAPPVIAPPPMIPASTGMPGTA
ncbi:hypothetical protein EV589_4993 [Mycobacterium sp. BK558]|nr:hypothetical protein EV589_4993 [Mycobacterium sp. BK558]